VHCLEVFLRDGLEPDEDGPAPAVSHEAQQLVFPGYVYGCLA
jgi:hypothetical protein